MAKKPGGKTEIIIDDGDDGNDDVVEFEPDLPDEAPAYPRWLEAGQTWYVRVAAVSKGTDFNGDPCTQIEGELTSEAFTFDDAGKKVILPIDQDVRINAGQPILDRLLRKNHRVYGLVGRIIRIKYLGTTPTKGGRTAKDFDVKVGKIVDQDEPPLDQPPF